MSQDNPSCPKCGSTMWDNRETKTNPKAPDFKCKDKNCDGVVWPPKKKAPPKTEPRNAGPLLPNESEDDPHLQTQAATKQQGPTVDQLQRCYLDCLRWSLDHVAPMLAKAPNVGITPEAIIAAAATLYISRTRR